MKNIKHKEKVQYGSLKVSNIELSPCDHFMNLDLIHFVLIIFFIHNVQLINIHLITRKNENIGK